MRLLEIPSLFSRRLCDVLLVLEELAGPENRGKIGTISAHLACYLW